MLQMRSAQSQRGMAAFAVTTAFILIISLIVMGYSLVTSRSQQQSLDRQLGQQATLAAETGANMVATMIRKQLADNVDPSALKEKVACGDVAGTYPEPKLEGENVKVTCLIVKRAADSLAYAGVTENSPTVIPLSTVEEMIMTEMTLTWRNTDGTPAATGCAPNNHARPTKENWNCGLGIMRIDIAPVTNGAEAFARTAFLYPTNSATIPTVSYASLNGGWIDAACSQGQCSVKINGLPDSQNYMAARSLYKDSDLTINGVDFWNRTIRFDGQAVIDATAKAGDVVKRIQVRVPIKGDSASNIPGYAIESEQSLCKRFVTAPGKYYDKSSNCN